MTIERQCNVLPLQADFMPLMGELRLLWRRHAARGTLAHRSWFKRNRKTLSSIV